MPHQTKNRDKGGRSERFIVKCQWPISTNEPNPLILIYNLDKTIYEMSPTTEVWRVRFGGELKVYLWAQIKYPERLLIIGEKAPTQTW